MENLTAAELIERSHLMYDLYIEETDFSKGQLMLKMSNEYRHEAQRREHEENADTDYNSVSSPIHY